ncbi:MAG: glycosyl hydrolase, partial [Saprospiraceae bacterium]|nr:glycosyl hydrolase [Saprospiraceae bacterium]
MLSLDEHTGVNDIVMDPRNPNVLYATAYQRRRHVFTYLGGGPGSAIYKSVDGGGTWEKACEGLPEGDLGRIGMSISPANPEIIYAIVEAQEEGGLYRSTNRGASWHKRGDFSTSGNYYQEIIADPINPDMLYAMDTWMKVSVDGGKTFKNVGEDYKHVDNHCIWINPEDTDHLLVGCDGGIYETWDAGKHWQFKANLPVTQFYKVAVDNAQPFYFIYGGTQDNFSLGGPSRSISGNGIANDEWFITHGGDGFESQVDPENPNIVYAQSQHGVLVRYDKLNGEELGIQPKPRDGEDAYRWNWDAPLEVSNHRAGRIYFAANKVFRSDDRGHSWEVISDDLTQQINRNELKVMDRVWSIDAVRKNLSTSLYGTIVAFSESPREENLLYIGTDDGVVQVTENGGGTWRKVMVPGAPTRSYVNEVLASHHDANVVYAAFNHHKFGDFKPYLFKSSDRGNTWENISNNLPIRGSIYAIEEDHIDGDLLFIGTEFGVFFSNDGGSEWKQLKGGLPTIAVRDIAIQERENDLVLGTFGRGFYVLDDYSALRNLKSGDLEMEAKLLSVRNAKSWEWSYPYGLPGKSFQGDDFYQGENLGPVAIFTYFLKEKIETKKEARQKAEKDLVKENKDVSYPTYDDLIAEVTEEKPKIYFTVKNSNGEIIRKLSTTPKEGVQRITWD